MFHGGLIYINMCVCVCDKNQTLVMWTLEGWTKSVHNSEVSTLHVVRELSLFV